MVRRAIGRDLGQVVGWAVCVLLVATATDVGAQTTHTISSSEVTVGINVNWGGAITQLDYRIGSVININNVNNSGGPGRQIEAAIYDAESTSGDCWPVNGSGSSCSANAACPWKWNPVQAGDACQIGSPASVLLQTSSRIVVRTFPRQWNPYWGPSNVIIDEDIEIVAPTVVRITYTVINNESFRVNSTHELPVVYLDSHYNKAVHYGGGAPWTNANSAVTERVFSNGQKSNPTSTTESWIGYVKSNGCATLECGAVLLYVPNMNSSWNIGRMEDGAALMQAWQDVTFQPGETRSVSAYLAVGKMKDARAALYNVQGVTGPPPAASNRLTGGQSLSPGQSVASPSGRYNFKYQTDGNLVLYDFGSPVWAINCWPQCNNIGAAGVATMQTDGNFVVYNSGGGVVWHTSSFGNPGAYLDVQDDSNVVVYSSSGYPLWHRW
jgi:hypothetical protein